MKKSIGQLPDCLKFFLFKDILIPFVAGYYVIPFGVCPSVRPCSPFPIDNLSIYSRNFFSNFAYISLSAMSGMGLLMGKIRPFLTE